MIGQAPIALLANKGFLFVGNVTLGHAKHIDGAPPVAKHRKVARGVGGGHKKRRQVRAALNMVLQFGSVGYTSPRTHGLKRFQFLHGHIALPPPAKCPLARRPLRTESGV
jgi:hypothetical protein